MIRCPESTIRQVERVPIRCDSCGYRAELSGRSEELDAALVVAGYFNELRTERALLQRLQTLLSAVPDWRERFESSGFVCRAPEFQTALAADPELHEFLRRCSFRIVPRFQFVEAAIREQKAERVQHLLRCPSCTDGFIYIEPDFFTRL